MNDEVKWLLIVAGLGMIFLPPELVRRMSWRYRRRIRMFGEDGDPDRGKWLHRVVGIFLIALVLMLAKN